MEESKILTEAAETLLEKPVTLEVDIISKTWQDKVLEYLKLKKPEKKRVFHLTPLTLGSLIKISKELIAIDLSIVNKDNLLESSYILMNTHLERVANIVAMAVVNGKADPPKSLVQFFINNLTAKELSQVFSMVLQSMNVTSFIGSIISIKGANILSKMTSASVTNVSENGVSL